MTNKTIDQNSKYVPEPGEDALAILIKKAGEEARTKKKKVMEYHFKKLHAAASDTLDSFNQSPPK